MIIENKNVYLHNLKQNIHMTIKSEQIAVLLETYKIFDPVVLYYKAVIAYETTEEPIMTDADFDMLKTYLIENDNIVFEAGVSDGVIKGEKVPLAYPMLSINSVHQSDLSNNELLTEYLNKKYNSTRESFELSWKYDGLALQAEYTPELKLKHILTRGERTKGVDVTEKMRHAFPSTVPKGVKCIIGEALLSKSNFQEHFAHRYKNERNTVAGLINADDEERLELTRKYVDVSIFKIFADDGHIKCLDNYDLELPKNCFIAEHTEVHDNSKIFDDIMEMEKVRKELNYRTDGVVIRNSFVPFREIKSGLYFAYTAYKFHAEQAKTKIIAIDFRLRNNGDLFPRAILEPVELDGSTVRHASLFNYGNMLKQGLFVGAEVLVAKSGDIIPDIQHVLVRADETQEFKDEYELNDCTFDGVNLKSTADVSMKRFTAGCDWLGFKDAGNAMYIKLFNAGYKTTMDLFNFDRSAFIGIYGDNKTSNNISNQIEAKFKKMDIALLMGSLRFPGIGKTMSGVLAESIKSNKGDKHLGNFNDILLEKTEGLNKWARTFLDSDVFEQFMNTICILHEFFDWEQAEETVVSEDAIKIMMTGSPKDFGYKTKAAFTEYLTSKGISFVEVGNIKEADVLVADNVDGNSSKLKAARAKGIEIKTYGDY